MANTRSTSSASSGVSSSSAAALAGSAARFATASIRSGPSSRRCHDRELSRQASGSITSVTCATKPGSTRSAGRLLLTTDSSMATCTPRASPVLIGIRISPPSATHWKPISPPPMGAAAEWCRRWAREVPSCSSRASRASLAFRTTRRMSRRPTVRDRPRRQRSRGAASTRAPSRLGDAHPSRRARGRA